MIAALLVAAAVALALPTHPSAVPRSPGPPRRQRDREGAFPLLGALGAGATAALFVGGSVGLVVGAAAAAAAHRAVRRMEPPSARRRREAIEEALPHVVDLLSACLAVGQAPGPALDQVAAVVDGPLHEELVAVSARLRLGTDPVTVWRDVSRHPHLGPWGRCVLRAVDSGASVADAMARLADDLRRESRAGVEARARTVGVRAALPLGLCLLPAFVLLGVVPLVAGSLPVLTWK